MAQTIALALLLTLSGTSVGRARWHGRGGGGHSFGGRHGGHYGGHYYGGHHHGGHTRFGFSLGFGGYYPFYGGWYGYDYLWPSYAASPVYSYPLYSYPAYNYSYATPPPVTTAPALADPPAQLVQSTPAQRKTPAITSAMSSANALFGR